MGPRAPAAGLTATDDGETRLRLRAHPDDHDQRQLDLVWNGCLVARMEPPNEEAISSHRLYDVGLREVQWLGEVYESDLIADLERRDRVHPDHSAERYTELRHTELRYTELRYTELRCTELRHTELRCTELRHWVAALKECTVEVVGRSLRVERGASA